MDERIENRIFVKIQLSVFLMLFTGFDELACKKAHSTYNEF